ncbi:unnamed protein product, partial [marine sediment metagenome]
MAEERGERTVRALVIGSMAAIFGATLTALLVARPAEAAPPEEKLNYLIQLLEQLAQGNVTIIGLLEQILTKGVPVEVAVSTAWVAKEPEQIYSYAIRTVGTFYSDKMVDWTKGKRLVIKVESTLNQAVQIQVIGNAVDDMELATDINGPFPCAPNSNISIGLA